MSTSALTTGSSRCSKSICRTSGSPGRYVFLKFNNILSFVFASTAIHGWVTKVFIPSWPFACKQSRVAYLLSFIVYQDYTYCPSCSVDEYHRGLDKAVYRLVRKYGWIFFDFLFFHFYSQSQLESCKSWCSSVLVVRVTTVLYDLSRHYFCGQWTGKNIATTSFRMHEIWVIWSHGAVQAFFTQGPE